MISFFICLREQILFCVNKLQFRQTVPLTNDERCLIHNLRVEKHPVAYLPLGHLGHAPPFELRKNLAYGGVEKHRRGSGRTTKTFSNK